jgi:hypothetical protein
LTTTRFRLPTSVLAAVAAAYGLPSVVMAFGIADATPFFRASSLLVGLLLVAGAFFLVLGNRWSVAALWVSAFIYAGVMLVPAFYRLGFDAFSFLANAFYISLAVRIALAAAAHALVRSTSQRTS